MKKKLLIITSPENDSGSLSYLKKIRKIRRESFSTKVDIMETKICSQDELEVVLGSFEGSVLILQPSTLKIPKEHKHRNVEDNQVVQSIIMTLDHSQRDVNHVLVLGVGQVGRPLVEALIDLRYQVTAARSNIYFSDEEINQFDTVINCTNCESIEYFYGGTVVDVSGGWVNKVVHSEEMAYGRIVSSQHTMNPTKFTRGQIGDITTTLMLDSV